MWDFIEEDLHRPLPPGERIMHTTMAIIYGAFLAHLIPHMLLWRHAPTRFTPSSYGWLSIFMSLMATGVLLSGIRDLTASFSTHTAPFNDPAADHTSAQADDPAPAPPSSPHPHL